jgi:hypothetical protein
MLEKIWKLAFRAKVGLIDRRNRQKQQFGVPKVAVSLCGDSHPWLPRRRYPAAGINVDGFVTLENSELPRLCGVLPPG